MTMTRRTLLASGAAVGTSAAGLCHFVGLDLGGTHPPVFVDAELLAFLRPPLLQLKLSNPPLQVLAHCRDLEFDSLKEQLRSTGHFIGLLQPASHVLVLEAVRDLFGRVSVDSTVEDARREDLGARVMSLLAGVGQLRPALRAVVAYTRTEMSPVGGPR